jgi:hypothetical protein
MLRPCGDVQCAKLVKELGGMTGLNSGLRAGQKKLLDPLMPEAAYHPINIVLRNATLHKWPEEPYFFTLL